VIRCKARPRGAALLVSTPRGVEGARVTCTGDRTTLRKVANADAEKIGRHGRQWTAPLDFTTASFVMNASSSRDLRGGRSGNSDTRVHEACHLPWGLAARIRIDNVAEVRLRVRAAFELTSSKYRTMHLWH
jgi:hypothetical protein